MPLIDLNDAVISQVRHAADIVDVVSQFTQLKQAGRSHKGLCPFHREKTPSFHVDRAKGMFYCFGCGTGGDVFKFVMLTERFSFPEAVEYVANRSGIELPRRKDRSPGAADKENLLEAIDEAADAFHQALGWTPNAAEAYLRKRGVDEELWRKYGFGYAPDSWDYILKRLGRKFQPKQLEAAGLVLPRKSGDGFYDRFRNRLIVPIHSEGGSILGFGGRSLDGSDPKYLNSPESEIFNKSRLLYNLHRARDAMRRMERAILVEGYFDCLTLDHAGVDGVVASMGTSLTTGQAALMRRFSKRVLVCYDGDDAGRNATLRAAPVLLAAGLQVDVVDVGAGEDPDTFLRKRGLDAFIELLANADDVFEFAIRRVAPNPAAMRGAEKSEAVDALAPLVAAVADPVMRNDAAQRVADRLGLEFSSVWSRVRAGGGDPARTKAPTPPDLDGVMSGEKELLRVLVLGLDPEITVDSLRPEYFRDPTCRAIFDVLASRRWTGGEDIHAIADSLRSEEAIAVLSSVSFTPELDPLVEERRRSDTRNMVARMRRDDLEDRLRMMNAELKQAQDAGEHERAEQLLLEKLTLVRELKATTQP